MLCCEHRVLKPAEAKSREAREEQMKEAQMRTKTRMRAGCAGVEWILSPDHRVTVFTSDAGSYSCFCCVSSQGLAWSLVGLAWPPSIQQRWKWNMGPEGRRLFLY